MRRDEGRYKTLRDSQLDLFRWWPSGRKDEPPDPQHGQRTSSNYYCDSEALPIRRTKVAGNRDDLVGVSRSGPLKAPHQRSGQL